MEQRILAVLARRVCREGLRQFLASVPDVEVVGEAGDGRTAVKLAGELKPDVTILEPNLPELNGVEATRQLVAALPGMAVIAVSVTHDWVSLTSMLQAGARAYVVTDSGLDGLVDAIHAVANGLVYLSPRDEARVITSLDQIPRAGPAHVLTPREREVLQVLAEGKSTRQAAGSLGVSAKTIETHRRQIMKKLGIHSIAGLTKYAIRHGITSLS